MVPMWTRAWRFANVYAYTTLDLLFAVLWFAAFISVSTWEAQGIREGVNKGKDNQKEDGSCSHFAYGSEAKCNTSKASVGFGVVIFLTFAVTSAISIHGLLKYRKTGIMPYGTSGNHGKAEQLEDPNKDAWSSNIDELDPSHPADRESEDEPDQRRAYGQIPADEEAEQSLLQRPTSQEDPFQDVHSTHTLTEDGVHPGRPLSYESNTNLTIAPPSYHEQAPPANDRALSPTGYIAPSALSPSDYEQTPGGRVNFPQGNYGGF